MPLPTVGTAGLKGVDFVSSPPEPRPDGAPPLNSHSTPNSIESFSVTLAIVTSIITWRAGTSSRLIPADAAALRELPELAYVSEGQQSRQQVIYASQNWNTNIVGVNVDYQEIKSWPMKYGAFFTPQDVQAAAKVCTLGLNVATNLFGEDVDPTGSEIDRAAA